MESDIIRRARQGDAGAWEALVSLHQDAVFRLAYLLLGSAADADDVAQEAFVRAYRYLHTFDTERPLRPWLLRIAANLARSRRRALGRYWAHLRRLVLPDTISDPEREYAEQSSAQALWQAVRRLEQNDQELEFHDPVTDRMIGRRIVQQHVLIWHSGGVTYRLESDLPLADAVRIAESLE